ncbi:hypothetical protein ScPMuIL_008320 [Solemya velum]
MAELPPSVFQVGTAAVPATQVEISVSCRNLRDCDTFSKSDPICVLFTRDSKTNQYYEYGRTEMIKDNLNPEFVKKFTINYFFEESQKLRFDIYDVDAPTSRLDAHDFLGRYECTLGEIVAAPTGQLEKNFSSEGRGDEQLQGTGHSTFQRNSSGQERFLGKSDPFLIFSRANEDNSYTVVHKTEVIKNTLNPTWKPFSILARTLCNGDYDRSIKITCYDWDSDGSHDFIGEFSTTLRELTRGPGSNNQYACINPKKKAKKKKYTDSGEVILTACKVEQQHTFLDYIKSGTQMNFTVAIDFTASNGSPSLPTSLHYLNPYGSPNQYAAAIQSVGEIIQDYDSDKLFPVLGFGARLRDNTVSHEFPLTFNSSNPYCQGISGVLQAYYNALQNVQLYGPTNFAPVINHVARFASASQDGSNYFVLLIITDGVITDMPQTTAAIVNAARLPMSIIIVGVGDADFEAMNTLDGDEVRLNYNGVYAERDIVQFVPFRDFLHGQYGGNIQMSQTALAKEVLAEIPDQFLSYMKKRGVKPREMPPSYNASTFTSAPPPS